MYKCQDCTYSSDRPYNLRRHEKAMHQNYIMNTVYSNNSRSHENGIHNQGELNQNYNNTLYSMNQDVYDIRLKENFKLFISGLRGNGIQILDNDGYVVEDEENNGIVEDIIQVLKYIKSIKGDYQEFAEHTNSKDIHTISNCCFNLIEDNIPLALS